jgi:hypothetical protein
MYPSQNCEPCNPECPEVILPAPPECIGEPCAEIMPGECVKYTGPAIPCLDIAVNENINSVLQKLIANVCGLCPVPVITTSTICDEGSASFTIKVSSNHLSVGTTIEVQFKTPTATVWTSATNIVTTGVALDDFTNITIPLNGSQTATYQVRARRRCVDAFTGWATATVTTPACV